MIVLGVYVRHLVGFFLKHTVEKSHQCTMSLLHPWIQQYEAALKSRMVALFWLFLTLLALCHDAPLLSDLSDEWRVGLFCSFLLLLNLFIHHFTLYLPNVSPISSLWSWWRQGSKADNCPGFVRLLHAEYSPPSVPPPTSSYSHLFSFTWRPLSSRNLFSTLDIFFSEHSQ